MSVIKRLTEVLTPPIRRQTPAPPESRTPPPPPTGSRLSDLEAILVKLLRDQEATAGSTAELLSQIKTIAKQYGTMVTAAEIRDTVSRLPDHDDTGAAFKKGRGFELAADLLVQKVRSGLRNLDEQGDAQTLKKIPDLVAEVLTNLFLADRHVKGVEICLDIADTLLERSCYRSPVRVACANTAEEVLARIVDLATAEDERLAQTAKSAVAEERRLAAHQRLSGALLAALATRKERVETVNERLMTMSAVPTLPTSERPDSLKKSEIRAHVAFLLSVGHAAAEEGCYPLAAYALHQAVHSALVLRSEESATYAQQAIGLYRKAAAAANDAGLHALERKYLDRAGKLSPSRGE